MNEHAFLSILGVEIRRVKTEMLRTFGLLVALLVVLAAIGRLTPAIGSFLLIAVAFSGTLVIPGGVLKDRLGGTMEFLATLPVSASTVVGGRFAAIALLTVPGAMMCAVAGGWFVYPLIGSGGRGQVVVASFVVAWAAMASLTCCLVGLLIRFKMQTLMRRGMIVGMAVFFGGSYALDLLFGDDPLQAVRAVMTGGLGVYVWIAILVLGAVGATVGSFLLARQGITNFKPELDSIEW